jgi:hypothetical protein
MGIHVVFTRIQQYDVQDFDPNSQNFLSAAEVNG